MMIFINLHCKPCPIRLALCSHRKQGIFSTLPLLLPAPALLSVCCERGPLATPSSYGLWWLPPCLPPLHEPD